MREKRKGEWDVGWDGAIGGWMERGRERETKCARIWFGRRIFACVGSSRDLKTDSPATQTCQKDKRADSPCRRQTAARPHKQLATESPSAHACRSIFHGARTHAQQPETEDKHYPKHFPPRRSLIGYHPSVACRQDY